MAAVFPPPPVPGLGAIGGFKVQIEDRAAKGPRALYETTQAVLAAAHTSRRLAGVFSAYQVDVPRLHLDVDRERTQQLGIPLEHVHETLRAYLGSLYVNDFTLLGRPYQVTVQADAAFRADVDDIARLQLRAPDGAMLPLAAVATMRPSSGPDPVSRYNVHPSADLNGGPAPGVSSGEAVAEVTRILDATLPQGFAYEWTDLTYQQMRDGNGAIGVFAMAVLLAFLLLAAQYNSWTLPLSVLVSMPLVLLGALGGLWVTGHDNNVFTQIGFVVLIGLAAKNAILLVEFARQQQDEGVPLQAAVLEACRLRLRPILMTSLAFVMGVVPLVVATGAGAEMRRAMGVAVFSGMLGVTVFGLLFTPVAYVLVQRWRGVRGHARPETAMPAPMPVEAGTAGTPLQVTRSFTEVGRA
jgi:multidrug efflux pump subunit AcrB